MKAIGEAFGEAPGEALGKAFGEARRNSLLSSAAGGADCPNIVGIVCLKTRC